MSELVTNKITPGTGSSDTVTLGDSGDTFSIPSGATIANSGTATGFLPAAGTSGNVLTSNGSGWASGALPASGGATPVLWVYGTGTGVSCPNGTPTKITFNVEVLDTQTAFDSSTNYRFTPSSGYYLFIGHLRFSTFPASSGNDTCGVMLYKNGSGVVESYDSTGGATGANMISLSTFQEANGSDYFELWAYQATGSTITVQSAIGQTYFQALKVS